MLSFIQDRPPLVICSACIIISTVTLFAFAFYVKDAELIPDSDKNHEWTELIDYFNKLRICVYPQPNDTIVTKSSYSDQISVTALVRMNVSDLVHYNYVDGSLILDGWEAKCEKNSPKPSHLEVSFEMPERHKSSPEIDICVTLQGPADYLPKLKKPNCAEDNNIKTNKKKKGLLASALQDSISFCHDGNPINFEFHPQNTESFANFLNNKQKNAIYVHLLWTSCFLLSVILLIVIYALFYNNRKFDNYFRKFSHLSLDT